MSRYGSGPSPLLIVIVGALFVFGGYYVWSGFLHYLDDQGDITARVTRDVAASATADAAPHPFVPTLYTRATFTPLPPCIWFVVDVERAVYRECPAQDNRECPVREVIPYGTELCIYGRVPNAPEWYIVELNPDGAYRDNAYIHESVVEAANPTPTATPTAEPLDLPTVTPTPSRTPQPTSPTPVPSATPEPSVTPESSATPDVTPSLVPISPTPPTPTPTLPHISV